MNKTERLGLTGVTIAKIVNQMADDKGVTTARILHLIVDTKGRTKRQFDELMAAEKRANPDIL